MRFEVLGPLRVTVGEERLEPGSKQQRKLLALLLASANRVVTVDRLIDEMWSADPPETARHQVQDIVWRLRHLASDREGPRIDRQGPGYLIHVDFKELDALRLEEAIERSSAIGDASATEASLAEVIGLWRGRPFGDLGDESPALQAEAARLEELYLRAMGDWVEAGLSLGRHLDLVDDLEALTSQYPYREGLWGQLMLALYRSGRQAEALRAYQNLRGLLVEDLGIEPGPEVEELERRILLQDPDLLWEPPPPPSNLPVRLNSFVGRGLELGEVTKLLDTFRLITLTGPGGIGKTRLAIEAADRVLARFADGVWWVDLASLSHPEAVAVEVANVIGVAPQPGQSLAESVGGALGHREALLVLDNCEHLVDEVAAFVAAMLRQAPKVRLLTTSRVPLHVSGEALWVVPALSLPTPRIVDPGDLPLADSVRLFLERGAAVDPTFDLTRENAEHIAELCRRLDGMPLAIEMAAAWIRVLSPAQIASSLDDRFSFLGDRAADVEARHETLQAAFDWSYDLLDPDFRPVFDRLSVFSGAFDLDAASAIGLPKETAQRALEAIAALVDASMITTTSREPVVRYRLLETLREYGRRHLADRDEEEAVRDLHASYFLGLVSEAGDAVATPGFNLWLRRLAQSDDDLELALEWSLERGSTEDVLSVAGTLYHYWFSKADARSAGRWGRRMLADGDTAPDSSKAGAHMCASFGSAILGTVEDARWHNEESVRILRRAGDRRAMVSALFGASAIALRAGDFATVVDSCREALEICDEIGDRWSRADPLTNLGFAELFGGGSLEDAMDLVDEAQSLYRELGDTANQIVSDPRTEIALRQGDLPAAERFAVERAAVAEGSGWEASALVGLGGVLLAKGDHEAAEPTLRRGLRRARDAGLENWFRIALRDLSRVALAKGDPRQAALLIGASRRNMPQYGLDPVIYEYVDGECTRALGGIESRKLSEEGHSAATETILEILGEG